MGRQIVIGDVHGCIEELKQLLKELSPSKTDRILFLGDLMDKGPDGPACVRLVRESGHAMILGNHEEKHVRYRDRVRRATADPSYVIRMRTDDLFREEHARLSDDDVRWFSSLPVVRRAARGVVAVHGGLLPGVRLRDQRRDKITRLRYVKGDGSYVSLDYDAKNFGVPKGAEFWFKRYSGRHSVVFGHEAFSLSEPLVEERPNGAVCWGIDTGCVHGGRLTAMVFDGSVRRFVQVQAARTYVVPHLPIPA